MHGTYHDDQIVQTMAGSCTTLTTTWHGLYLQALFCLHGTIVGAPSFHRSWQGLSKHAARTEWYLMKPGHQAQPGQGRHTRLIYWCISKVWDIRDLDRGLLGALNVACWWLRNGTSLDWMSERSNCRLPMHFVSKWFLLKYRQIKIKSRSFKISPILSGVFLRHGRSALIKLCKSQVGQIKAMIGCFVQAVFSVQPFSALFLYRDLASHCILSTLCLRIRGL